MKKAQHAWVQRVFGHFSRPQTQDTTIQRRVTPGVIESADRVLRRIPVSGAKAEICAVLTIIQGIEIVSPSILSPYCNITSYFFPSLLSRLL